VCIRTKRRDSVGILRRGRCGRVQRRDWRGLGCDWQDGDGQQCSCECKGARRGQRHVAIMLRLQGKAVEGTRPDLWGRNARAFVLVHSLWQVLRLRESRGARLTPLRMTRLAGGFGNGEKQIPCGNDKQKGQATARANDRDSEPKAAQNDKRGRGDCAANPSE